MKFVDAVPVAGMRRRDDGYLVADARVARIGIQTYAGWEVGMPDMRIVKVYRPEAEVFSRDTLASFAHRPVTNDHPDEMVTADNWKELAVGQTADEIARDGQFIRVPLMVADAAAIKDIEVGKRELSAGYLCDLAWEPGTTPQGEAYDAVQKNIRANHVAIVQRGRAGSEVRIGDAGKWGAAPITPTPEKEKVTMSDALRTVVVDGLSVQTTDQGAQAITKLLKDLEASASKITELEKTHQAKIANSDKAHAEAIKAKDGELAKKDEEIGALKADKKKLEDAAPKPADIDKMVAARAELVTVVKAIDAKIEVEGKSDADLRRAAVKSKLGDAFAQDGVPDAEIAGMFKAIAKDVKPADPFAAVVKTGLQPTGDAATVSTAYKAMTDHMTSAWQTKGAA